MHMTLYFVSGGGLILVGLILQLVSLRYRRAEYFAIPWYRRFRVSMDMAKCYEAPGHLYASFGMSLAASGALILLVLQLLK